MFRTPFKVIAAATLLAMIPAAAQPHRPPVVNPDRSVTFTLIAPKATKVFLGAEFDDRYNRPPGAEMVKDEKGVWTFATRPLDPGVYGYGFVIDDLVTLDPGNRGFRAELRADNPLINLIEVPGEEAFAWEVAKDAPRGSVHVEKFRSEILQREVSSHVYTPPGYEADTARTYPVLYLLHGNPGASSEWTGFGFADRILDNLIASGKTREMIVVMLDSQALNPTALASHELVDKYLREEVIPRAETRYRIDQTKASRWIAGFSRGGAYASYAAFRNPDLYSALGSFSIGLPPSFPDSYPAVADAAKLSGEIPVMYYTCAEEDARVVQAFRNAIDALTKSGLRFESKLVPRGSHSWQIWRDALADFLTRLK